MQHNRNIVYINLLKGCVCGGGLGTGGVEVCVWGVGGCVCVCKAILNFKSEFHRVDLGITPFEWYFTLLGGSSLQNTLTYT